MRTYRAALAAAFACLVTTATPALADEGVASFVSAPKLKPPTLTVNRNSRGQAPGYIFVAIFQNKFFTQPLTGQGGPMILDNRGHYVWLKPASKTSPDTLDLQVQRYRGKPVLTYWDGTVTNTGEMTGGTWHVLGQNYRQIASLKGADGWEPSGHEMYITQDGHALISAYKLIPHANLTSVGGGADQPMLDSGVLDYDIASGSLLKAWSASDHIPVNASYTPANPNQPTHYDPYHINSIDVDGDGNWLVSLRNTWGIYKVNSSTGAVDWTLGGKLSNFAIPDNVAFAFQHNARWLPNGELSIFDNDCCALIPQPSGPPKTAPPVHGTQSRALVMKVDQNAKTVSFDYDRKLYDLTSGTQGNMQLLPNGNAFVGWGQQPFYSEFSKTGKLLLSVRFPDPDESYRAFRYQWVGHPSGHPALTAVPSGSATRVYASWNGATEVTAWRIWAGRSSHRLKLVAKKVGRVGFETARTVHSSGPYVKVQALDRKGRVIGTSRVVRRQNTSGSTPSPVY